MTLSEPRFRVLVAAAVICAAFLSYSNTLRNDFVWDDGSSILYNDHVKDPHYIGQLFREDQHPFGRGQGNFYRPLLAASFMLDYQIAANPDGSVSPVLFHVNSILWHAAAALLLFALISRLGAPPFVRIAVPLIYAVHPLHSEAVAYISSRADSMAAAFTFAAIWFGLWDQTTSRRIAGTLLGALCFIAALLSKEAATIYPVMLAILVFAAPLHDGGNWKDAIKRRWPPLAAAAAILAVYGALRMTVLHFASSNPPDITLGRRLLEMLQAFALYMRLMVLPSGLHMERTLTDAPAWLGIVGFLLIVAVLALLAFSLSRKDYRVSAGFAWFIAAWLPISGLFPLNAPMAEHWMYVPMAGLLWALAEYAWRLAKVPAVRFALIAIVAAAGFIFAAATADRNRDWRDNESIFRATLDQNPNSIRVHYNLAVTYEDLQGNVAGARRHYTRVVDLYKAMKAKAHGAAAEKFWDDELESHLSLGRIYLKDDDYQSAADHFKVCLQIRPEGQTRDLVAEAAVGMGHCLAATGNYQRAMELYKKAVELQPALRSEIAKSRLFASQ